MWSDQCGEMVMPFDSELDLASAVKLVGWKIVRQAVEEFKIEMEALLPHCDA